MGVQCFRTIVLAQWISLCAVLIADLSKSIHTVNNLSNEHDIVLLQEHWLLPFDLPLLNTAHRHFFSVGLSAVDISSDILVGRPYGGTAILYHKCLADKITNCYQ